jgi:hypothetical protein
MAIMRIRADGGMGNRFNAMFTGLIAAVKHGWTPVVIWPVNDSCGAGLDDLFSYVPFEHSQTWSPVSWPLITHWPWENRNNHNINDLPKLVGQNIELTDHTLRWDENLAAEILRKFVVKQEISDYVNNFCSENQIDRNVTGYQIRGSDNYFHKHHMEALEAVKDKTKRFFVCSDQKDIEDTFRGFENVVLHNKENYTEKLDPEKHWVLNLPKSKEVFINGGAVTIDVEEWAKFDEKSGKLPSPWYNTIRNKDQSVDAFRDMLILARTNLVRNHSTFNQWARIFSNL